MKKSFALVICFTLVLAALSGCAKSSGSGESTAAPSAASTMEATSAPVTSAPADKSDGKPIVLSLFEYSTNDELKKIAKEYHDKNPNVTVNDEQISSEYNSVLGTKINAGDTPDIFMTEGYNANSLYKDYVLEVTNEDFMKDVEDGLKTSALMDGKYYGLPIYLQSYGFIYNKKLFADAGITELPKTVSQLEAASKKLSAKGIIPFANDYKEWWVFKHIFTPYMAGDEGDYHKNADAINTGAQKFGSFPMDMKVFDLIDLTLKYGSPKPLETDFNAGLALIGQGKAAMIQQGTWAEDGIRKIDPKIDIGFFAEPVGEDASKAKLMVDSSVLLRISNKSKHIDEVKKFLAFLNQHIKEKGIGPDIPTVKGAKLPDMQLAKDTETYIQNKMTYPWVQGFWPSGFDAQLGAAFQDYVAKGKTKEQVMDSLNSDWQKLVKDSKK